MHATTRLDARSILLLLLSLVLAAGPAAAQEAPWRAQWIGLAGEVREGEPWLSRPNLWLAYRKEVTLERRPARAVARIACDSKYWLWVNGELVVFEGQLKRGPNRKDTYHDTVDLAPWLREGTNTIAVLVWHWGRSGYSHDSSGTAGLVFDADLDGRPLLSDRTWKVRVHPAYGTTDAPHPGTALPEQNVRFDARRDLPGWERPGHDDRGWRTADEYGVPPVAPWNALVPRPIPQWKDSGLRDYASLDERPGEDGGRLIVARLPYDAQVTPYLEVEAPAGLEIRFQTDTYDTGGGTTVRGVYVTRSGAQRHESYGWMSGHEVHYRIPAGVRVIALKYRETGYDADFAGRFESDDPALNTLWTKARRTLYVNMRDGYMDCPDRERAQWWGDLVIELGQAFYALDAGRGPLLARKGIRELVGWRREDRTLVSPIPYGKGMAAPELPMQILAAVGWHGFWTYYRYTGDRETMALAYPAARDYLRLWRMGADGLVVHRTGDWDWADWGDHADVAVLENAWYHLALRAAVEMARLAGQDGDVPGWQARMRSIEAAFDSVFWRGDRYRSPAHEGATDDRANAMAVVAGLARPEYYPALREVLRREEHASPYMEKYVLEALYLMDAPGQAVERMKRRWGPQIESPLTTLWEQWVWNDWNTYNHGWSGGALTLLQQYAAGVAPTEPGWAAYAVLPRPGPLRRLDTTVPTPRGAIDVRILRDAGRFRMTLASPAGTRAVAGVPTAGLDVRTVVVDGDTVWREGAPVSSGSGVRAIGLEEGWIKFDVPPGAWSFETVGPPDGSEGEVGGGRGPVLSENPVHSGRVVIRFTERPALAGVYSLSGARVVDLLARMTEEDHVVWDLANDRGARVAPGVYLLVIEAGGEVVRRKVFVAGER